jgi:hypothetical protein
MANGLGIAGLVCGILSILTSLTVFGGIVLGILGLIFGIIGRRKASRGEADNGGMALAGAICGGIGLVLAILLVVVGVSVFHHHVSDQINRYDQCVRNAQTAQQLHQCHRYLND